MKKAIVAGHICIDITPVFPADTKKVGQIGDLLKPGKLITMNAPDVNTGGAVANTGLGMKIMGADVRLLGKIGNDEFGGMIRSILAKYDAGRDLIVSDGETSSYSVVVAVPGIDRIFLHCPGANDTFDGSEITDEMLSDVSLFHFGYPPLMKKMYEDGGNNLRNLFRRVKSYGIATSLDLAAVDAMSEAGRADWEMILSKTLPCVDFFVPSFEELCFMLDRQRYEELQLKAGNGDITEVLDLDADVRPLAEKCIAMGAKAVLVKCGTPGLFLKASDRMDETGERLQLDAEAWNGFETFQKSFRIEKVLSGTGAGDTSIAAFLTSLLEGASPKTAIENAAAAGALCCTSYDAVSGLKRLKDIRALIDGGWGTY